MTSAHASETEEHIYNSSADLEGRLSFQGKANLPSAYLLSRILDELNISVILTDTSARVLYMNKAAKAVVRSGAELNVAKGAVKAGTDLETNRLRRLIRKAACITEDSENQPHHFVMALGESGETAPQPIIVAPLSSDSSDERAQKACVALFVAQKEQSNEIPIEILRVLFGLTSSEATLASHLMTGTGLGPAAMRSSMGINTARTHLKKIFWKTQTGRQAELVGMLLRCVGMVKFD